MDPGSEAGVTAVGGAEVAGHPQSATGSAAAGRLLSISAAAPHTSGSVANIRGKPLALAASVARVALVSATSRGKTATTQTPC